MNSIIQREKYCYLCEELGGIYNSRNLESHHIFGGTANRRQSEKYGLKVWLCNGHHRNGKGSAHHSRIIARQLHEVGQRAFEEKHGTREEFVKIFGKNYLESEEPRWQETKEAASLKPEQFMFPIQ